jgi:hypothetical protein
MIGANSFCVGVMTMGMRVRVGRTNEALLRGELDPSAWTDEELVRGQRRDKNGRWTGRPPTVVPAVVHQELTRRRMSQAFELLRDNVLRASEVLIEIATDPDAEAAVRVKAASIILDRVLGKAPERVELSVEPPWAAALRGALVSVESIEPSPAIDITSSVDDQ